MLPEQKLEEFRQAMLSRRTEEDVRPGNDLPIISESTCWALLEDYGITAALKNIGSEPTIHPYERGRVIAEQFMVFFKDGPQPPKSNGMFFQIAQWQDGLWNPNSQDGMTPHYKDASLIGFSAVVDAFAKEFFGKNFLEQLRAADPKTLFDAFQDNTPFGKKVAIIDRLRNSQSIPHNQVFLNDFLYKFGISWVTPYCGTAFQEGSVTGYHVIEKVWPDISKGITTASANTPIATNY